MNLEREYSQQQIPIWQGIGKDISIVQGGFLLASTGLAKGTVIKAGTPFVYDEVQRNATMVGGGVLQAAATNTDTTYKVEKGHTLKVGDYLALTAGSKAYAITTIDTTNADYDTLTVGTTLGAAAAVGANVFASTATGATAAAYPAVNGLLYSDVVVAGNNSVSIVNRGIVYARRIPFAYSTALAALSGLSKIIFSQSK